MASTLPSEIAGELLKDCLNGNPWSEGLLFELTEKAMDPAEHIAAPATQALFSILVEHLADLFEPRLCDVYSDLFSTVIARAIPSLDAAALALRYREVRQVRPVTATPQNIFVLSRVTLGADVAVTSVLLDAARQRFPGVPLWLAGPMKAWELFERSPDVRHLPVAYGRGSLLRDRLAVFEELRQTLSQPGSLVLDPDSRLTQLGLLPVCPPENHHLFESRSFGGDSLATLPRLACQWARETLGVEDAQPWLHPKFEYDFGSQPVTAVSLGVGENPAKRIGGSFESDLLKILAGTGSLVMVDAGAPGGDEERRVQEAIAGSGLDAGRIGLHQGSFASFAAMIAASALYCGYDSAGQHVAAALGVPLITVFAGYASERMFARWYPESKGPRTVLRATNRDPRALLAAVRSTVASNA